MQTGLRRLAATALSMVALALVAPGPALAGTLDQQQTDFSNGGYDISSTGSWAQTFTAGLSGGVDQVDLYLQKDPPNTVPLSVDIRNVLPGGSPGATVLASQSVAPASIPAAYAPVAFKFSPPAPVTAGTRYAIVAHSADAPNGYLWGYSANPYPSGAAFTAGSPSGPWSPNSIIFAFRTYVGPLPSAGPTGQRAAALKKCKHKHGKKRKKCKKKAKKLPV